MSIQVTGAGTRFRVTPALVALALAVAVFVLAVQASSTWSTRNEPQVQPRQAIVAPAGDVDSVDRGYVGPHCRPKYGCENEAGTAKKP